MTDTSQPGPLKDEHGNGISITIKATDDADLPFVRKSFRESYKEAPKMERLSWKAFKATAGKDIDDILSREDTRTLGAYDDLGRLLGFVVWTPGRSISTLHYVYTRHALDGVKLRRRGIATALLEEANLGKRLVYTFRGAKRAQGVHVDEMLVEWARKRGVTATPITATEFLR